MTTGTEPSLNTNHVDGTMLVDSPMGDRALDYRDRVTGARGVEPSPVVKMSRQPQSVIPRPSLVFDDLHRTGLHRRERQREPVRGEDGLGVAAVSVRLARLPRRPRLSH